jgi:hypothetical protein
MIRVDLAHNVAIRPEELVKIAKEKVGEDVDAPILKLYETYAMRSERVLQTP